MSQPLTCDSPQDAPDLCSSLVQCGYYADSTIEIPPVAPLEGVVLFQPTTETDPSAWALLQACCAETGIGCEQSKCRRAVAKAEAVDALQRWSLGPQQSRRGREVRCRAAEARILAIAVADPAPIEAQAGNATLC